MSLEKFVAEGGADFGQGKRNDLELCFPEGVGQHLAEGETPLSADQTLTRLENGDFRQRSSVADTRQLRWWLFGFGPRVEVRQPPELREWVVSEHRLALGYYEKET